MTPDANAAENLDEVAEQANAARVEITRHVWRALELSRDCGERLAGAQALVPPSRWNAWLSSHFTGDVSEANTYLQVYRNWDRARENFQRQNNCVIGDSGEVSQ